MYPGDSVIVHYFAALSNENKTEYISMGRGNEIQLDVRLSIVNVYNLNRMLIPGKKNPIHSSLFYHVHTDVQIGIVIG